MFLFSSKSLLLFITLQHFDADYTAQEMRFSMKDFFSKCDQICRKITDLFTFTEEIYNGKPHFDAH